MAAVGSSAGSGGKADASKSKWVIGAARFALDADNDGVAVAIRLVVSVEPPPARCIDGWKLGLADEILLCTAAPDTKL